jgi:hypothetical protein
VPELQTVGHKLLYRRVNGHHAHPGASSEKAACFSAADSAAADDKDESVVEFKKNRVIAHDRSDAEEFTLHQAAEQVADTQRTLQKLRLRIARHRDGNIGKCAGHFGLLAGDQDITATQLA